MQHGPSNLGQDIVTLDFEDQPVRRSPSQAPIGTRPETSGQNSASGSNSPGHSTLPNVKPTLNPNAPSFSFFTRSKKKDDGEDTDRSARKEDKKSKDKKGKDRDKDANAQPDFDFGGPETPRGDLSKESSPPGSRRSRDTRSISTADGSFFDLSIPRDSLEQTQSRTPSDAQQGGGGGQLTPVSATARESFMQKLSRKTSATSSKLKTPFSFTTRKATSSAVAGDGAAGTPEETDEDLSRSVESVGATPPAAGAASSPLVRPSVDGGVEDADARKSKDGKATRRSWSSLKLSRRERRKEREEESVSESVDASETGEEDEGVVHEVV
ncbi:MAG: hypothetical protein INR71_10610 [Terriglobus roseus]|nr:hypothetical protein [Terriglobus roseus]